MYCLIWGVEKWKSDTSLDKTVTSWYAIFCVYIQKDLILFRDGSYGLLRRPIRYNTLLIRNTRIIQKRIDAILGGTLGLHQPPSNHHELSPSLQNIIIRVGPNRLTVYTPYPRYAVYPVPYMTLSHRFRNRMTVYTAKILADRIYTPYVR